MSVPSAAAVPFEEPDKPSGKMHVSVSPGGGHHNGDDVPGTS